MAELRLVDLNPMYYEASGNAPDRIAFTCPRCRLGVVTVWLKEGDALPERGMHGCDRLPPDFETITITPSIADEGKCRRCPGWHGHITNGKVG